MKLRRLWLGNYYNLRNQTIEFAPSSDLYRPVSLRFFIGVNGSGKSKALEALALIFSHLAINVSPGMDFEVQYEINDQEVLISTRAGRRLEPIGAAVSVSDDGGKQWRALSGWGSSGSLLPEFIVGNSTGPTTGLPWALSQSAERLISEMLADNGSETQEASFDVQRSAMEEVESLRADFANNPRTLYLGADEALCAVLPLLAHDGADDGGSFEYRRRRSELISRVQLSRRAPLAAFSLELAPGARSRLSPKSLEKLDGLRSLATAGVRTNTADFAAESPDAAPDECVAFDVDASFRGPRMRALFPTPLSFFQHLLAWKRLGAVKRIRLILKKKGVSPLLPDHALSDGEYLYLGRLALLLMLRSAPESLVLLDEPETHFNDCWKAQIVSDICRMLGTDPDETGAADRWSHEVIVATHSDLTLVDADYRQVYLFEDGQVHPAPISPFGADREEISRRLFYERPGRGDEAGPRGFSRTHLDGLLTSGSLDELLSQLQLVGPGFDRFQLRNRIRQLAEGEER